MSRKTLAVVGVATFSFVLGWQPSFAQDESSIGLSVTDTLVGEYHADNQNGEEGDDDYGFTLNRLNLNGTSGDLTAALQVDSFYFIEPPTENYLGDTILERFWATYRLDEWELVAGDFYHQLGRGLVLSVRQEASLGRDITIRGGRLVLSEDDHFLSAFGGLTNSANLDNVSQHYVDDVADIVVGGSYEFSGIEDLDIEIFTCYLQPEETLLEEETDSTVAGGIVLDLPAALEWLSLYGEADIQNRRLAGISEQGFAGYLSSDLLFGDLSFLLEGLLLDEFEMRGSRNTALNSRFSYYRPPTLERIDQEVANNRDVLGGRLRVEYYFFDADLTIHANGMVRLNNLDTPSELTQIHGFGGFDWYFQDGSSRLSASGGYRDENQVSTSVKSMIHGELDYLQSLSDEISMHLTTTTEIRTVLDEDFLRGGAFVGVEAVGLGALTFEYGYDTQNPSDEVANHFFAGIVSWFVVDELTLRAVGGTQRGGIKCVAGVCREFPPFAGGSFELVGRF